MTDEAGEVDGNGCCCYFLEERTEWNGRAAVGTLNDCRNAFLQVVCSAGHLKNAATAVGVDIDKAGRHRQAFRINTHPRLRLRQMSNRCDCVTAYSDISVEPGIAGAVENLSVLN